MQTTTKPLTVADIMRREVTSVREDEPLALALQIMLWREIRHLPVTREGRVVGILSERDLLSHRSKEEGLYTTSGHVIDAMQKPAETIHPKATVADAAATMGLKKIGCLPVVDAGALVGIVTTTDLLSASAWLPAETSVSPEDTVESIMSSKLVAVRPDDPLEDAAGMMIQHGVRHLPVIDGLKKVVGILSERDVRTALGEPSNVLLDKTASARLSSMKVSQAMTEQPRTIDRAAPLEEACRALVSERFGALPVVDDEGRLLGIVSYMDLLRLGIARAQ